MNFLRIIDLIGKPFTNAGENFHSRREIEVSESHNSSPLPSSTFADSTSPCLLITQVDRLN
ncbi:MAG: hypothetical protein A2254_03120 [Ignavibacteria bacterium RIFOXYA2_FULL_35_9]|nr:MAG: hypothetical protein A2254_03120 [Ignavibacteria bacterium RIFOXYA2_FULL_35_9]